MKRASNAEKNGIGVTDIKVYKIKGALAGSLKANVAVTFNDLTIDMSESTPNFNQYRAIASEGKDLTVNNCNFIVRFYDFTYNISIFAVCF